MAIVIGLRANDDELIRIGTMNPGYTVEREADGTITMSPTHTKGGAKSAEALGQLWMYARTSGGKAFDSNTGFAIGPGERVTCPDASWVSQPRIDAIPSVDAGGFWPISPDVAIEVSSDSDDFSDTVEKVEMYIERGAVYAVAIDPRTRAIAQVGTPPPGLALDFDAIIDA